MSKTANKKDKNRLFHSRFLELCNTEDRSLTEWEKIFGTSRQTIANWQNGKSIPVFDQLINIARYFDVSTDYLTGLSDTKRPDTNLRAVMEYTGLSEDAVSFLREGIDHVHCEMKGSTPSFEPDKQVLSDLLVSPEFSRLVDEISTLRNMSVMEHILERIDENLDEKCSDADSEEFFYADQQTRQKAIYLLKEVTQSYFDDVGSTDEPDLSQQSDDYIASAIFSCLCMAKEKSELHLFYASKAIMQYLDKVTKMSQKEADQWYEDKVSDFQDSRMNDK